LNDALDRLRTRFGLFLVPLLWGHVLLQAAVAQAMTVSGGQVGNGLALRAALAAALVAAAYHVTWRRYGTAPATRYLSVVALMAEPAMLLFLLRGHPWQMDMHMYFFAMLALTIAWLDRRAILVAAVAIAAHHALLLYLLPYAVFPEAGNFERVLLHAAIVAFQTGVLIWLNNMLLASFAQSARMSEEIGAKNIALEERTREAEEATRAKSMFLANMSHEIRTPMNAILGFCHLVSRTDLDKRQRGYVERISGAGASLLRLINDILDYSKNEAGKLTLEARPFDLRAAVAGQIQLLTVEAAAKGVRIVARTDHRLPVSVVGDELRFSQVVLNLLSNAVKFSDRGEVTVAVDLLSSQAGGLEVALVVRDHGIGMDGEQQASLFRSFSQGDSSTTRRFGGTGLGLAICRQIVEQMGGDLGVESAQGQGSTFTCRMRFAAGRAAGSEKPAAHIRALRVLAADDNAAARQLVEEIFEGWDMGVDLVASGDEAVAAFGSAAVDQKPYDLVLLDWKMPGMDGMEAVRELRRMQHGAPSPVTLIVTAYSVDEMAAEAGEAGVSAFLTKPIDSHALLETISSLFAEGSPQVTVPSSAPTREARAPVADGQVVDGQVAGPLRGLRVLLVEDNEINREIATELLTHAGLVVDCAENGRVACDKVAQNGRAYAGVLMDVQMPEMDGIEATTIIRRTWPMAELPIIAITAHAFEAERQRCLDAGMNDHVAKPVDPRQLIVTLDRWLKPAREGSAVTRSGAPSTSTQVATVAELPDRLGPFDIAEALKRVNGKAGLLRKLIVSFAATYGHAGQDIRDRIAAGQIADARRLAHSLKGVAGSLELRELQACASDVEQRLAHEDLIPALAAIQALEPELDRAVAAAGKLAEAALPKGEAVAPHARPAPSDDGRDLSAACDELRALLRRRSLGARSAFERLAQDMGLDDAERAAHPLHHALQRLDYVAALALLEGLAGGAERLPITESTAPQAAFSQGIPS
jgi:signal transduction histidine kinase/DNA-binding response OmpR family regulator